ncbi:IS21 family transposase [Dissulfurispira thermophila]|nr:IS21 family transposase [Dissulfurispira thermophila]
MYKWQQVRVLRQKGETIKGIARQLKLSRNTVRKYLRKDEPPQFKARQYERLLDPYEEVIKEMLKKGFIGTRIYNELKEQGYGGSLCSVHRYLSGIREGERVKTLATTRVETSTGKQMQYDWKEWMLPVNGRPVKVYIHEIILSYSRKKYYCSSLSITTADIIRAIASAIEYFGGIAEEIVIDNPRQMVIAHNNNGVIRYNDEFLRFCGLYGIDTVPCRPYRARTKGKVERPFYYIQEHLLKGLEVEGIARFDGLLYDFTERYNKRTHSDLGESPEERFMRDEKPLLRPIPEVEPAEIFPKEIRSVTNDGYISWAGALYPVPMKHCLRQVKIETLFGKTLKVYSMDGSIIAEHDIRVSDRHKRPVHPEHEQLNREYRERKGAYRSETLKRFKEAFKQQGEVFIEGLKKTVSANMYWHIEEILKLTEIYTAEDITAAMKECIECGSYHKNSIKRLLKSKTPGEPLIENINNPCIARSINITRPLSAYRVMEKEVLA